MNINVSDLTLSLSFVLNLLRRLAAELHKLQNLQATNGLKQTQRHTTAQMSHF